MKSFKHKLVIYGLLLATTAAVSCKKSFFSDVNINTNAPDSSSIIPSVMLSTVEGTLAYTQGGDISRFTSLITQQTEGSARQAQGYYQYTFTSVDFDQAWGNLYTSVLQNNKVLLRISDAKGDHAYSGISRVLMAYSLQMAVDMWGSIPYSDAFKGASNLQPKYDNDKALYDTINTMLTTAISLLSNSDKGPDEPGAEDVIYQGDNAKWIKFAHAIKARLFIHQSKGNAAMATSALAEIAQSFSSNDDNAVYQFGSTETSANPWYQFNEQRTADIAYDQSPLAMRMMTANDPRYTIFADSSFNDVNGVGMGSYYGNISSPVELITYDELQFMKAEALLRSGGSLAAAQTAYVEGITANMEKLGVKAGAIGTYLATKGTLPGTTAAAISQVAAEEYVALYLNPEAFTLWRRTASPTLTPITGANVPRRFLYPQTEYSYNEANVSASTLYTPRIFWDL
ncbi:MAG TPA: SusD/RagB family nutrient-binding outer membrane lipoprotein [Chitinophagaceae bacterium]|nr:SusD/RagB family nutrient-binding outer membrane lipoprotein [Chitinophagaceae bacterium]